VEQVGINCVDVGWSGTKDRRVPLSQKHRKRIGLTLLGARQEHGWRQIDAADHSKVSRVTIGKIEHGEYVLPRTLEKYARDGYGLTLRALLQTDARDDLDDESRDIGHRYRLAPTAVRQATTKLLTDSESKERKE